jgi:hypothetical protein
MAEKQASKAAAAPAPNTNVGGIVMHPTPLKHVFYIDVADNGQFKEVAVVKEWPNGSLSYIDISLIDNVDRGRLKKVLTGGHADKYPLWDLLSQERLSNGKNALDYFHQMVKVKKAPGHVDNLMTGGGSLFDPSVRAESSAVVGSAFTDTASAVADTTGGL